LTKELPEVSLALSLHAPNQPMREAIVPTAKMYPIEDIVDALDEHMMALIKTKSVDGTFSLADRQSVTKRKRAMIEYVMCKSCILCDMDSCTLDYLKSIQYSI
jgi:adenine C2-methylase RlmN of 23S rRNA A2503 and tRNA A37